MSNTLYNIGRENFLARRCDWATATIKCSLVDIGAGKYTFNATHQFFSVVSGLTAVIGGANGTKQLVWSQPPNTLPVLDGAADADDVTFNQITGTRPIGALIIWEQKTSDADSPLIAYIDTATGLPITPNGGDIIVTWDNGVNKIFRL